MTVGDRTTAHSAFQNWADYIADFESQARDITAYVKSIKPSMHLPDVAVFGVAASSFQEMLQEFPIVSFESLQIVISQLRIKKRDSGDGNHASFVACWCAAAALAGLGKLVNEEYGKLVVISWATFKTAYATFPQLIQDSCDIQAVQAVTLMANYASFSANARLESLLLANATRLSQLHASTSGEEFSAAGSMSDQAQKALWAAFILETESCLHRGSTPSLNAEDVLDVDLPTAGDSDPTLIVFRKRAELSLIQSTIRAAIYSRPAIRKSLKYLESSIETIGRRLDMWKLTLHPTLDHMSLDWPSGEFEDMASVTLKLAFYNATSMAHWPAICSARGAAATAGCDQQSYTRPFSVSGITEKKVRASAQYTLQLLKQRPPAQFAYFWSVE